jgi:hypothetical protein
VHPVASFVVNVVAVKLITLLSHGSVRGTLVVTPEPTSSLFVSLNDLPFKKEASQLQTSSFLQAERITRQTVNTKQIFS